MNFVYKVSILQIMLTLPINSCTSLDFYTMIMILPYLTIQCLVLVDFNYCSIFKHLNFENILQNVIPMISSPCGFNFNFPNTNVIS